MVESSENDYVDAEKLIIWIGIFFLGGGGDTHEGPHVFYEALFGWVTDEPTSSFFAFLTSTTKQ
jgi:hypothetical protein